MVHIPGQLGKYISYNELGDHAASASPVPIEEINFRGLKKVAKKCTNPIKPYDTYRGQKKGSKVLPKLRETDRGTKLATQDRMAGELCSLIVNDYNNNILIIYQPKIRSQRVPLYALHSI